MSKLSELRTKRQEIVAEMSAINAKTPQHKAMPAPDAERFETLASEVAKVDAELRDELRRIEGAEDNLSRAMSNDWHVDGKPTRAIRTAEEIRAHYMGGSSGGGAAGMKLVDFVRGVAGMSTTDSVRASLSIGTEADGGYLVPSILMPTVLEALVPASACLTAGAAIVPFSGAGKSWTYAGIDTLPTAAWRNENGAIAESQMTFRVATVAPKSLAFYFKMSRELLMDAVGLQDAVAIAVSQAFAKELDRVALLGTGTAPEPRGLANLSGVHAFGNGANGASLASTKYANFFGATQLLLDANAPMPTGAVMSNRSLIGLGQLVDTTGQPLQRPEMLQDMRFVSTSQIPDSVTVGTSTDCSSIFLGDFTKMFFAMREQFTLQRVDQAFATTGQIGFIGHVRADVLVTYPKAFAAITGIRP